MANGRLPFVKLAGRLRKTNQIRRGRGAASPLGGSFAASARVADGVVAKQPLDLWEIDGINLFEQTLPLIAVELFPPGEQVLLIVLLKLFPVRFRNCVVH